MLRLEQAQQVLDIGCGEGSLLSTLCNPAQTFFDPSLQDLESPEFRDIYLTRLGALDIVPALLAESSNATTPAPSDPKAIEKSWVRDPDRWNPLEVTLWQGSLDAYNPELATYDHMIAMEVIEHLPEDVLPRFAPMVLGRYRPKCLLVTTPNYSFNVLFTKPDTVDPGSFPDPTGRTSRRFRHDDHKFEWTEDEFRMWCEEAASTFGYTVEIGGIGKPISADAYGRAAPFASQTAVFRRQLEVVSIGSVPRRPEPTSHVLFARHLHQAHPSAGVPALSSDIRGRVKEVLNEWQSGEATVRDLWNDYKLPYMCGGSLASLLNALEGEDWQVKRTEKSKRNRMAIEVVWTAFTPALQEEEVGETCTVAADVDSDGATNRDEQENWSIADDEEDEMQSSMFSDTSGWEVVVDSHLQQSGEWGMVRDWGAGTENILAESTYSSAWSDIRA